MFFTIVIVWRGSRAPRASPYYEFIMHNLLTMLLLRFTRSFISKHSLTILLARFIRSSYVNVHHSFFQSSNVTLDCPSHILVNQSSEPLVKYVIITVLIRHQSYFLTLFSFGYSLYNSTNFCHSPTNCVYDSSNKIRSPTIVIFPSVPYSNLSPI